jgi:hypothetical protein
MGVAVWVWMLLKPVEVCRIWVEVGSDFLNTPPPLSFIGILCIWVLTKSSNNTHTHTPTDARNDLAMDMQGRKNWLPKLDFPFFDGEEASVWMDNCESYFEMYQIPAGLKVCATSMHLKGKATLWFQASRDTLGVLHWNQFKGAVLEEFEANTHYDKMLEVLTLRQNGSILEYKSHFDMLVYHIRLFEKAISETFLVTQFVLGLKHELRVNVEVQFPQAVSMATQLAMKYEGWQARQPMGNKRFNAAKGNPTLNTKDTN